MDVLGLVAELERLNARYEIAKMDPEWDEAKLQILITAQFDLATFLDSPVVADGEWYTNFGKDIEY